MLSDICVCSVILVGLLIFVGMIAVYKLLLYRRCVFFFFQAEDGIRDLVRSRGLGDVYKRQAEVPPPRRPWSGPADSKTNLPVVKHQRSYSKHSLSLIHI